VTYVSVWSLWNIFHSNPFNLSNWHSSLLERKTAMYNWSCALPQRFQPFGLSIFSSLGSFNSSQRIGAANTSWQHWECCPSREALQRMTQWIHSMTSGESTREMRRPQPLGDKTYLGRFVPAPIFFCHNALHSPSGPPRSWDVDLSNDLSKSSTFGSVQRGASSRPSS
jgi:hypothetical protein